MSATLPDGAVTQNLSLDGRAVSKITGSRPTNGGITYLDTEPWRGEPLLTYLRKMVFWSDVVVEPADLAVLSLLGPGLADDAGHQRAGVDALPAEGTRSHCRRWVLRRMPGPGHRTGPGGAPRAGRRVAAAADRCRRAARRDVGLRGAPGGRAAAAAGRRHRRADHPPRGRLDRRSGEGSTWTRAATAARRPSLGSTTWANHPGCWCCCTSTAPRIGPSPATRCWRADGRSAGWAPSSTTSTRARSRWRWSNGDCRPTPPVTTGGEAEVAAVIDADSLPAADVTGAGSSRSRDSCAGGSTVRPVPTMGLPAHRSRAR